MRSSKPISHARGSSRLPGSLSSIETVGESQIARQECSNCKKKGIPGTPEALLLQNNLKSFSQHQFVSCSFDLRGQVASEAVGNPSGVGVDWFSLVSLSSPQALGFQSILSNVKATQTRQTKYMASKDLKFYFGITF
jgi:hypothetical protein